MWRLHYFVDVCRLLAVRDRPADALRRADAARQAPRARPLPARPSARRRRSALLGARGARELSGRRRETLGRRVDARSTRSPGAGCSPPARASGPSARLRLDAVPPPIAGAMAPERTADPSRGRGPIAAKIAPLRSGVVRRRAPARVNLLIPTIDLEHFFGGYIGEAQPRRGGWPSAGCGCGSSPSTRSPPLPPSLAADGRGLQRACAGCSTGSRWRSGATAAPLEVSRADRFIATTWWTAPHRGRRGAARSAASGSCT